ncbi:autotransporter outer membrane beta-barrel domain-containing protein [Stenotrophomonas sp. SRS1]|nr:autotransporter outer membrane beta-barrel domain-containing protein [Stenotrophomonas sp. SRS1]
MTTVARGSQHRFLSLSIAAALMSGALVAGENSALAAVVVGPGQTLVVNPGDYSPTETFSTTNGTLDIRNGTATGSIAANGAAGNLLMDGGTVTSTGPASVTINSGTATISNSSITNGNATGLSLAGLLPTTPGIPSVLLRNSVVSGGTDGALVSAGGTLTLVGATVTGQRFGAYVPAGSIEVTGGSVVRGGVAGISVSNSFSGQPTNLDPATWHVLVDDSRVESATGAAIVVQAVRSGADPEQSTIVVQNNAQLVGGNGNILEVKGTYGTDFTASNTALNGNVVVDSTATANLTFQNAASLTGALTNVTSMALADASRWNVTADSTVGALNLGSGTLAFAAPSPGYKTVAVAGDMTVNGGTLIFNSVLAGDGAPSDKLVVGGNTSGNGNIVVNNIGGAGAQTTDGIQLISVAGTSGATFAMNGRATGGVYEYLLYKGGVTNPADGGWYLRSAYTGDPCDLNPSLPICAPVDPTDPTDPVTPVDPITPDPTDPVPVLRPEPGAYLANQAAAIRMFQQRRHDRGEPAFEHDSIGAWARVSRDQLHTTIAGQVDAHSQSNALQIGSDVYRWGQGGRGQIGIMLATGDANTQATSQITGYGTRGKVKGDAVGVYGTWVQSAEESAGLYVDGWLQYGRYDSWVQGDGLARETYNATTRAASVEAGYGFALSNSDRRAIYLQPQVQVSYTDYKGDTLQEVNGTLVEDGNAGGLETRVGVRLFGHDNAAGNRVQPFVAVNWLYNARGDTMRFDGETLDAKLPTNRYEAQAGAQLRLGERWSAWGDLRVQRGDSGYKDAGAQLGVRRAW